MNQTSSGPLFAGIDVAKASLELGLRPTGETSTFENSAEGIALLVERLRSLNPQLVVMEATGGLEMALAAALAAAQIPLSVVNPRQVRDFAKATGKLAKTDAIDALCLAHFADAIKPEPRPIKDEDALALNALQARRRQVLEMLTAEKNRLSTATKWTKVHIQAHITWLEQCLKDVDSDLNKAIQISPVWRARDALFQSVKGVGRVMSLTILCDLPEIGSLNRKQVAALAGVAPLNRDSGSRSGTRSVWSGRSHFRAVLYMSALVASRWNPVIKAFHDRLIQNGKTAKVAIVACMRKLLVILNAMTKNNTPWRLAA